MSEIRIESASDVTLPQEQRANLRDWFDQSGHWAERMTVLYRLIEQMLADRAELAWEQGWVARGNHWGVEDNPYRAATNPTHHEACSVPVLGPPRTCTCNPAVVDQGMCVRCGHRFPAGGAR